MPEITSLNTLVVDDDSFALELFVDVLEELGVSNCKTALSGKAALEIVTESSQQNAFDFIICDLEMPDMDGLELLRRLAEADYSGKVAIISGVESDVLKMATDLGEAHNLDVIGAVQKPIKQAALSAMLTQVASAQPRQSINRITYPISAEDIQFALDNDEFTLFYQPKIEVKSQRVYGAEALIRWFSSKYDGIVGPDHFITVAEEAGLINALTQRVIERSIVDIKRWKQEGHAMRISINVSMRNLSQLDFASNLSKTLMREGVEPKDIMLEITESSLIEEATKVLEVLARLKMLGIGLSIDDFGTGYSSMGQLQKIPFVELKIDRSFVVGAGENASTRSILESSTTLAKQLQITSVAEGVETREDWDRIADLGIDIVQGYFVSKPLPAADFGPWVMQWAGIKDD
jgi:EAL domain-containing protein (putative c-di-GMP-specific phosphodiesterase class I)/CheY-like chemotaxis protein